MGYWIAVVDDEPLSLTNAKNMLNKYDMRVSCLRSGKDLLKFVEKNDPDLVLLDVLMPEMDGFETYRALRVFEEKAERPRTPVIFLTGESSSETERRGLKAGASDFIHKPFDEDILVKRIKNTIVNSKMIESLTEEATQDKLTGFLNKASGTKKVAELCKKNPGALLVLDLDNFKLVNDLYGHDMGDRVLVAFGGVVRRNVRFGDVSCRIGGDEFMIFMSGVSSTDAIRSLSERLNAALMEEAEKLMGENHGIPLGISIGVTLANEEANDYQILFQYADNALYEVKRNGKHGFVIYDPDSVNRDTVEDMDHELARIIQIMSERGEGSGAMLLGQDAFAWNYRYIERFLLRYGGVATRLLFTLSSEEKGILYTEMISEFGNVLKATLRKSDIIFQWLHNRYFVLLPQLGEEDAESVIRRIMSAWENTGYLNRMNVSYAFSVLRKEHYESAE